MNDQTGGFRPNSQGSNQENWCKGKGNKGWNYDNYNREGYYVQDGKMVRRFDASDEHTKELRINLAGLGQKVDTHAISIKHLEL